MNGGRVGRFRFETEEEIQNRPEINRKLLSRILGWLAPYWPKLLLSLLIIVISAVLNVLPSILTGRMIDQGFIAGNFSLLVKLVIASVMVMLGSSLLGVLENYMNVWVSEHIARDMKNEMYAHLQQMSQRFYTTNKQGDIMTRMTGDVNGVQRVITGTLTSTVSNVAVLVTSIIAMVQKNWLLALVGIAILPLFILPTKNVGKKRWQLTMESQKQNDEANQILNETLSVSGQQLVKIFTNEEQELQKFERTNEAIKRLGIKESMAGRWFRMAIGTFTNMGPMLIYLIGGVLILKMGRTDLTVGDVTVMVTLLTRMYRPVSSLLGVQVDFFRALALFDRIFEYLDMPVEIENKEDAIKPSPLTGVLRFEHVDFGYNHDKLILKDVTFEVPAQNMTAIVGQSGVGKSTITYLVMRLYDVNEGRVTIDGHDVRDIDLRFLRQNIGMVTQEAYLFNGSIRDNLLYAKHDATEDELIDACKEANIYELIDALPDRFDTLVGNRGVKLSGGEKQRLSIARIILKDPKIIIFDEATSALDSISESLIQEAIEPLLKGRTSLVIAHRLSTIMAADQILVMEDGRIVEQGKHDMLLQQDGTYTRLYEAQFKKLLEDEKGCASETAI
ncbi:MAG: ABC transporter ATP-binding protein/permease [Clostridiales bacterium]|jgi:ATP-binding cassette subfamily B protein|nr:ABC transporter ATP-binding protein/permease [Clostridiales bacterium]MDD2572448.1 ABC transporter ATP-binding protein [Eubacteriales bacterium]MDD4186398.1 ABC transporter ATP-binding protein [Eubacteriales bacterium]